MVAGVEAALRELGNGPTMSEGMLLRAMGTTRNVYKVFEDNPVISAGECSTGP